MEHQPSQANGYGHSNPRDAAHAELAEICSGIAITPLVLMEETLRHAVPFVREKIELGLVDKAEAVDRLHQACEASGATDELGADWVQRMLANGFLPATAHASPKIDARATPIVYECASAIRAEPVEWIWRDRIPRGKFTLLGGDPDQGKTLAALTIGATITRGGKWPDGSSAAVGNIIILSAEDDAADTIVPRLLAADADMSRVFIIESVRHPVSDDRREVRRLFQLEKDLTALEVMVHEIGGASFVMIDVIDSYMGGTDTHRNAAVRGILAPIKDFAARRKVAVLGLTHFSKDQSNKSPVLRFTGSIGFIGQARAGWVVTPELDENDEPTGRKLLVRAKGNLAPDPGGLAYRIETATVGDGIVAPRWFGMVS